MYIVVLALCADVQKPHYRDLRRADRIVTDTRLSYRGLRTFVCTFASTKQSASNRDQRRTSCTGKHAIANMSDL